jgi:hypothetical protein
MSAAVLERPRTATRVGFPWVANKHGLPMLNGRGEPLTVLASDLAVEAARSLALLESARLYLRHAHMRACGDLPVSESIRIALLALAEATEAATARRDALGAMC